MNASNANLEDTVAALLGGGVRIAVRDPRQSYPLADVETQAICRAIPKRRCEFSAGRDGARACLAALGHPGQVLPVGPNRAPVWPAGFCGTITHCADVCLAAAASVSDYAGLGLDVEIAGPLSSDVTQAILSPEEQRQFAGRERLAFCAKEAAYKAISSHVSRILEFSDVALTPASAGCITARLTVAVGPFPAGFAQSVFYLTQARHIITGCALRSEDLPC